MRPLMFAVLLAGCGSDTPAATPQQHFLGTWSFASGTDNIVCPTGTTAQNLTGDLTVKTASGGGLVVLDAEGCNFTYTLNGEDALLGTGKTCSFALPMSTTADLTYDSITLSTHDGKSMSDVFSGTVRYTASTGTLDCAFSGTAMLSKVSDQ